MARYNEEGCDHGIASIDAISHYAVEAAILKVYSSEVLDYVVDEAVQIHGGMGYSAEMDVERAYRDSRINRIFEGTNEINTLLVVDTAMKRAMKGDFDLFGEAEKLYASLDKISDGKTANEDYYEEKLRYTKNFKHLTLLLIYSAVKTFEKKLVYEQEIMNNLSVMIMETYVTESSVLRVQKIEDLKGKESASLYKNILDVLIFDSAAKIRKSSLDAIYSFASADEAAKLAKAIENLTTVAGVNVKEARRSIADKLIDDNVYKF
ncbi:putative acyl-CoA dehydrogenase [subsurface metagenome]